MKKICVLTGAGMSAESGIKTFRASDGLWEEHDIMEVASPSGWERNPELVLEFYNARRRQLLGALPNQAHIDLAGLDEQYQTVIITQNIDDLHERAGSKNIIHLHGELLKVRSTGNPELIYEWTEDLNLGHTCADGFQLRPHIVWFGESVPMLIDAIQEIADTDIVLIIGTSMQVYPAASLIAYAPPKAKVFYIDPNPQINHELQMTRNLEILKGKATIEVKKAISLIAD